MDPMRRSTAVFLPIVAFAASSCSSAVPSIEHLSADDRARWDAGRVQHGLDGHSRPVEPAPTDAYRFEATWLWLEGDACAGVSPRIEAYLVRWRGSYRVDGDRLYVLPQALGTGEPVASAELLAFEFLLDGDRLELRRIDRGSGGAAAGRTGGPRGERRSFPRDRLGSMVTRSRTPPTSGSSREVPALENGDRLTRTEFERRYEAMPGLRKAELIDGVVYLPSPTRLRDHGRQHGRIVTWLGVYAASTPGTDSGDNSTIRLDQDNEPQPDALLRIDREGLSSVDDDGYVEGPPELAAEVSRSTVSYDLGAKLHAYRRRGVLEYLVWRVADGEIDWFALREGRYVPLEPAKGIVKSAVFPGLWLDRAAMLAGDLAKVLSALQKGLASREHAAFVRRLRG